jgi:hypothetical protein
VGGAAVSVGAGAVGVGDGEDWSGGTTTHISFAFDRSPQDDTERTTISIVAPGTGAESVYPGVDTTPLKSVCDGVPRTLTATWYCAAFRAAPQVHASFCAVALVRVSPETGAGAGQGSTASAMLLKRPQDRSNAPQR